MNKMFVMRLYFPLDALHVSDYISPSSGATFYSCASHLVYAGTSDCCVAIGRTILSYNHTTTRRIGVYQMRCTAYKVAPDDGLIQSETCRTSNEKVKSNHKNFAYLVGLYAYCKMMHGAYSVNLRFVYYITIRKLF